MQNYRMNTTILTSYLYCLPFSQFVWEQDEKGSYLLEKIISSYFVKMHQQVKLIYGLLQLSY